MIPGPAGVPIPCTPHFDRTAVPPPRPGSTRIELLVVFAVIGVLAGMLLPALSKAKEGARSTVGKSNLRQLSIGMLVCADDPQGSLCRPGLTDRGNTHPRHAADWVSDGRPDADTNDRTRWKTPGYGFHAEAGPLFPDLLSRARSPYRETSTESFPVHRCPCTGPQGKALRVTFSRNRLLDPGAPIGDGASEGGPKGTQINGVRRPSIKVLLVNETPRTMKNAAFHPDGSAINGSFVRHDGRVDFAPMDAHVEALRDRRGGEIQRPGFQSKMYHPST